MGESAVAARYAEALYELGREEGRGPAILTDLARLKAALDGDPQALQRLLHPRVEVAEKEALLKERFLGDLDPLVGNAIRLLLRNQRVEALPDFFRVYLETHEAREGIVRVVAESATALDADAQERLREKIAAATGATVVLEARTDPELLGGLRLVIDSKVIDGSLRRRLERIERGLRTAPMAAN